MKKEAGSLWLSDETVDQVAQIFKVLADPTRIKILYLLSREESGVNRLADMLGLSQSAVSHQLRVLKSMRLVKNRRSGQSILYSCDDEHVISLLCQAIDHAGHEGSDSFGGPPASSPSG